MKPGDLVMLRDEVGTYLWNDPWMRSATIQGASFKIDLDEVMLVIAVIDVGGIPMALIHDSRLGRLGWKRTEYLRET